MISELQKKIMKEGLGAIVGVSMDWDELKKVEEQLKTNPDDYKLWNARGILYFNEDLDKALESFSRAIALNPFCSHLYYNRGRKYLSLEQWDEALVDLRIAIQIEPNEGWRWHYLGVCYYWKKDFKKAIECFEKSIDISFATGETMTVPQAEWCWMAYAQLGDIEGGQALLRKVDPETITGPTKDPSYVKRVALKLGMVSLEDYVKSLDYSNDSAAATELYGLVLYYYYLKNDKKTAEKYVDEILALKTERHSWGYKMARVAKQEWFK